MDNLRILKESLPSVGLFVLAGLCEIGGGYCIWLALREHKGIFFLILGAVLLVLYGVIPTLQHLTDFGRLYAAYGGVFVVMSLMWGWLTEGEEPDVPDAFGAILILIGVAIVAYWPRSSI